jgi:superoxide dismutase, Cu-Zn family
MRRLGALALAGLIGVACERVEDAPEPALRDTTPVQQPASTADQAVEVQLRDAQGRQVGVAHLTQQGDSVEVHVRVQSLTAGSEHGIHFHENAECTPPAFESAGAHFNPANREHGLENPRGPHAGDMPNLRAGDDGVAEHIFRVAHPRTSGMTGAAMGDTASRAVAGDTAAAHGGDGGLTLIVHAQRDDQRTDPSGNSGDRIACGVARLQ